MYVLQHADRPDLYSGLPKDPKISALVEIWKGAAKPIALLGLGLTALFGFFHYVTAGPNEVDEADEEEAKKTIGEPEKKTADDRAQIRHRRPLHACCASQSLA
jgi:formate dehydrogenase iron-sulfur subunit